MLANRNLAVVIVLATAMGALAGLLLGSFHISPGTAGVLIGIAIGMAVARGAFSRTPKRRKYN